jgi:hypothetical protein
MVIVVGLGALTLPAPAPTEKPLGNTVDAAYPSALAATRQVVKRRNSRQATDPRRPIESRSHWTDFLLF